MNRELTERSILSNSPSKGVGECNGLLCPALSSKGGGGDSKANSTWAAPLAWAALVLLLSALASAAQTNSPQPLRQPAPSALTPGAVLSTMERVADWTLANPVLANPSNRKPTDWTVAALDTGFMALSGVSTNQKYAQAMMRVGESTQWELGRRRYDADDHCIGQTYAELYLRFHEPRMIAPLRERFDDILAHPSEVQSLDFKQPGRRAREHWAWCDALFMGPPTWARLSRATGDARYLDFAVTNWWWTSSFLYDQTEHLYYRDSTFFTLTEADGKKVFWGRGNGWVMAGLVRMLEFLPEDHPARTRFVQQFHEMSEKILACQQSDGLWRASLLDPASYPLKETSASGFYTYAFAWGINHGLLDRAKYAPAARAAWNALTQCVEAEGKLTHVQPVGSDPKKFDENATEAYGIGAFLLAGSEVYRLRGENSKER